MWPVGRCTGWQASVVQTSSSSSTVARCVVTPPSGVPEASVVQMRCVVDGDRVWVTPPSGVQASAVQRLVVAELHGRVARAGDRVTDIGRARVAVVDGDRRVARAGDRVTAVGGARVVVVDGDRRVARAGDWVTGVGRADVVVVGTWARCVGHAAVGAGSRSCARDVVVVDGDRCVGHAAERGAGVGRAEVVVAELHGRVARAGDRVTGVGRADVLVVDGDRCVGHAAEWGAGVGRTDVVVVDGDRCVGHAAAERGCRRRPLQRFVRRLTCGPRGVWLGPVTG